MSVRLAAPASGMSHHAKRDLRTPHAPFVVETMDKEVDVMDEEIRTAGVGVGEE